MVLPGRQKMQKNKAITMATCYSIETNSKISFTRTRKIFLNIKNYLLPVLVMFFSTTTSFAQTFKDYGATIEQWDILDLRGDSKIYPSTDATCPPGYGPQVLHIEGDLVLGMVKGKKMSEGTFVALYHENEPRDQDADGIILVKSDYELDISIAHNTKKVSPHVWLEQDNDCGIQLRSINAESKEVNLAERCGFAVVTDPWNRTNWIWQKVTIDGNRIRAKAWPAHQGEPDEWAIEAEYSQSGERFGFKINSGNINLAYFAADRNDLPIEAPSDYLYAPIMQISNAKKLNFTWFTNRSVAVEQNLKISVINNGKFLTGANEILTIPSGSDEFGISLSTEAEETKESIIPVHLPGEPAEGPLQVILSSQDGARLAGRTVRVLPVKRLRARFSERRKTLNILDSVLAKVDRASLAYKEVRVIHDAAKAHLDHAVDLFDIGKIEASDMAFRFVDETLGELEGFKKVFLNKLDPGLKLDLPAWDENDRRGIGSAPKNHLTDSYSMTYLLSFGVPEISAQSMVMGRTYTLTIPWQVEGGSPDRDYNFEIRLVSPLGNRIVARSDAAPDVPTSRWKPGNTYLQQVTLSVSPEDPSMGKKPPAQPAVLDEYHYLLVSVPGTGARLILGNAPGPQPERIGHSFCAGEVYVSSTPVEIKNLSINDGLAGNNRHDSFTVANAGNKNIDAGILYSVSTQSGQVVYEDYKPISIMARASVPLQFNWESKWAGELEIKIQLRQKGICLTEAKRKVTIDLPRGMNVLVAKENHVIKNENKFFTPIRVKSDHERVEVFVYAGDRQVGSGTGSGLTEVKAEPWFGYYDVVVTIGEYSYFKRLIATVVETTGTDLVVNGEPFLVKGVNVHGLDGRSPEKSASMMRIMRGLGFNAWRGDYPPLWQMELAYQLNSFYTVLAPFSCVSTEEIFARQDGPPLATARALSRLQVERYKDSAGVLLWNSCNEVTGEKEDFLITLEPVYHTVDSYVRPVHYANLYGQDLYQGQDIMGINYYIGAGQTAKDRQPIIQRSIDIARTHNMPVMYNEFNSYAGALHSTGVDAMVGLYQWGVEQGMCGGFQYMKGNSASHPGIFDDGYNTHKIYNEAIIDVLADAEVTLKTNQIEDGKLILQVRNKRRFTLRQVTLRLTCSGSKLKSVVSADIAPESVEEIRILVPDTVDTKAVSIDGTINFVTHYGFISNVPVSLIATRQR